MATVKLNHFMFRQGFVGVRSSIASEFLILFLGLFTSVFVIGLAFKYKPLWQNLLYSILSVIVFFIMILTGVSQGAALVYAT